MASNTEKAKPYEYDEIIFDGNMDPDRLLATWEKKYQEELKKKDAQKSE